MPSVAPIIRAVGNATRFMYESLKCGRDPTAISLPPDQEHLRPELLHIAACVVSAARRQYQLSWDSRTYHDVTRTQDGGNHSKEMDFMEQFPPMEIGDTIRHACTVIDTKGRVEVIYLPGALSPERQKEIVHLSQNVRPCLERNGPKPGDPRKPDGWRRNRTYYRSDCKLFAAGLFTASPGWQMRGHETKKEPIMPSKDLASQGRMPTRTQGLLQSWVRAMTDCALLLSAVLAIVHPHQFEASLQCLVELGEMEDLARLAEQWAFAFTAVSVVSNRCTPEHRDKSSGGRGIFDLLLSIGGCPRTVLELPGLGARFIYDSGTIALFSGHVHLHTVSLSRSERMCIACYSRKAVYHKFGQDLPRSATIDQLWFSAPDVTA